MKYICECAEQVFERLSIERSCFRDLHLVRFFSSYAAVINGKAVKATEPQMIYCPLGSRLYKHIPGIGQITSSKEFVLKVVNTKIAEFGFFTGKRELFCSKIAVPYGASEMLMYALKKRVIDAAVVVCEGAGTVICPRPEVVQGIGARMNAVFYTSVIADIRRRLEEAGCFLPFKNADISQIKGAEKAAEAGYKNIAVTVNALMDEDVEQIRRIEKVYGASITVLTICTTGASPRQIERAEKFSDLVWSCGSEKVREVIGKKTTVQLSKRIPVFALTGKGLDIISGYSDNSDIIKRLDPNKQYVIESSPGGEQVNMGNFKGYIKQAELPVCSKKEPEWGKDGSLRKDE